LILGAFTAATEASCPPEVSGNTPEAIRANGERIVCLQNELAAATRQRHFEMQLEALQKSRQDALIQQRIDSLPDVPVYEP
jgi:hypothetical protein